MKICDMKNCHTKAEFHPVLKLWAEGFAPGTHPPAKAQLSLCLCRAHMAELTLEELLTDDGWNRIANGFRFRNKRDPSRASAQLTRTRIKTRPVMRQ